MRYWNPDLQILCSDPLSLGESEEQFPKDTVGQLLVDCQLMVGRQLADRWPTVGQQSANSWLMVGQELVSETGVKQLLWSRYHVS